MAPEVPVTVTVCVTGIPPPPPPPLALPPAQAVRQVAAISPANSSRTLIQRDGKYRRRRPNPSSVNPRIPASAICSGALEFNGDGKYFIRSADVAAAEELAFSVSVTVCAVPGTRLTEALEKLHVTPAGRFEQVRATVPVNPEVPGPALLGLNTTSVIPDEPGATDTAAGFSNRLNCPFTAVSLGHTAANAAASTEPSPVAMSYPVPALQHDITPAPPVLPVQFGLPATQTTALLPVVTSWKAAGVVCTV